MNPPESSASPSRPVRRSSDWPGDGQLAEQLAPLLFARALPGEIEQLSPDDRRSIAAFMAAVLAERIGAATGGAAGAAAPIIRIEPLTTADRPQRRQLRLAIIGEDRPFLVDSICGAIAAAGIEIHRLLHPIIAVAADAGAVPVVRAATDAPRSADWPRVSLIYLEIDRVAARQRAELAETLTGVLADVQAAVSDWPAMLDLLKGTIRALADRPPPLAPHRTAEAMAFLEWLAADNFTLLGARVHAVGAPAGEPGPGLGLLRDPAYPLWTGTRGEAGPPPAWGALLASPEPVLITRAGAVMTVHRRVNGDLICVKGFDRQGRINSETRFLGLYTSAALSTSPRQVPLLRRKVGDIIDALGFGETGHSAKALLHVLERFPRADMFEASPVELQAMALGMLSLLDRPRPRLFARPDPLGRTVSVLAFVPRDAYTSGLREAVGEMLARELAGCIQQFEVELRAEGLARVQYVVGVGDAGCFTADDEARLDACLGLLVRGWDEALERALADRAGPIRAARLTLSHGRAFSTSYRAQHAAAAAADDILALTGLSDPGERAVRLLGLGIGPAAAPLLRLKVYRLGQIIPLSAAVPVLENFGLKVVEEYPFDLAGGRLGWIHDFRAELPAGVAVDAPLAARLEPALARVLAGTAENDGFNGLVTVCGLALDEADWLRAIFRYLRQTGVTFGVMTVVDALKRAPAITHDLVALLRARFDPAANADRRAAAQAAVLARIDAGLAAVASLDDDRILRLFRAVLMATLRTNALVPGGPEALAFKIDSTAMPGLPRPVPHREIWVHSAAVEGIHLRGGPIARGGLRWSDRRDDFRTEVLGLVKAQMVKNAVIVPTGAKGGFFPKQLPAPADRDGFAAAGLAAYRLFIRALLSVTDNLDQDGRLLPPAGVACLDGPDPYLVVAADKGTASFSDTANGIARAAGFWLDDAFASGGGNGYDHKAMAITARGAWISVERHFDELGIDVNCASVRAAGVGDMSGDVFGNGMLLSPSLALVAAFDHRHIFLDPAPAVAAAHAERARLFALPRSSWDDYDRGLISPGGGVFARSLKSVPLSLPVQAMLGVTDAALTPADLIAAILAMPVDLLWFGGIGTYVKAAHESHADVGDKANDAVRIDAARVCARVIGEGANLALTQAARIEFARAGGRINTDFIDNSAGVDCSDHEVNIKIALNADVAAGRLARDARDALLRAMTDDVADLVLRDNRLQTQAISLAEAAGAAAMPAWRRLIARLEASGLDRQVEGLASDEALAARAGEGLARPELAVIMAYAKMACYEALVASAVVDDPLLDGDLFAAFPAAMHQPHGNAISQHRLRREIIATKLANDLVNRAGLAAPFELADELGVGLACVARAFVVARALFGLPGLWQAIDTAPMPAVQRLALHRAALAALRAQMADALRVAGTAPPSVLVARLQPGVTALDAALGGDGAGDPLLRAAVRQRLDGLAAGLAGSPAQLVARIVHIEAMDGAIGIALLAADTGLDVAATARAYTLLGEATGLDWALGAAAALSPADIWERLLAAGLVRDFEVVRLALIGRLAGSAEPVAAVQAWLADHAAAVARLAGECARAHDSGEPTAAMLAHLASLARAIMA